MAKAFRVNTVGYVDGNTEAYFFAGTSATINKTFKGQPQGGDPLGGADTYVWKANVTALGYTWSKSAPQDASEGTVTADVDAAALHTI